MARQGSVLIVDDEIGPRESLRMILKPLYNVHTAENGYEALRFLRREEIDLVTLDLRMPGITGIDLLKEIRKLKNDAEVVIISGCGTLANAVEAIRYGAVDFISKPFNVAEIISIVTKSVERHKLNRKVRNLIQRIRDLCLQGNGQGEALANLLSSLGRTSGSQELHRELTESIQQLDFLGTQKISVNYLDFFKVLIYILESKEPYTSGHSERVSLYSDLIAQDLGLPREVREDLQIAALMHDIGKIGLSNRLLEKADLTPDEKSDIRQHPIKGVRLIEPLSFSHDVVSAIRHHHERWDGKGYPDGLAGESIPLLARIITLADSYDAMVLDRPYRQGLPYAEVQEELGRNAGFQFDPRIVPLFSSHLQNGKIPDPIYLSVN